MPDVRKVCLNLGCGSDLRRSTNTERWINLDAFQVPSNLPPDIEFITGDIRNFNLDGEFDPYAPSEPMPMVDFILAQDVLEHIPDKDAQATLRYWYGHLKSGGTIQIRVPDFDMQVRCYVTGVWDIHQMTYMTLAPHDHDGNIHHNLFTGEKLRKYLFNAGFGDVRLGYEQHGLHNGPTSNNANVIATARKL